ncbi:hypothetical protein KQI82_04155 [Oscillibacter sp. MSJ-2]|uniref:Flavodoxin-like domain-containing protein n=1 Tax=Dysosmobacter acutus TaxID=2841504 RepID=A0ABS6F759_9FIRM|nr:cyclophilin-like fold protein [Dysosmobacter acutus]MBU5626114.1 hypothetical protein [Dysosmobacter acutus]
MKKIMRRAACGVLATAMLWFLSACGNETEPVQTPEAPLSTPQDTVQLPPQTADTTVYHDQQKILIAYFSLWENAPWDEDTDANTSASVVVDGDSAVGTTAYVARMIQEAAGGDLHPIVAAEPYPADFQAVVDTNHSESSREISDTVENMDQYDTVFIGYPVWATTLPQAVRTFLTSYDFSGKTVIPFCTHDGYGAGRSFSNVAELAAGSTPRDGLVLAATEAPEAREAVESWLDELGLNSTTPAEETAIRITVEGQSLESILYDSPMAAEFLAQLPQTITMSNYGGREVYGGIDIAITPVEEGQYRFDNGDITYCPANNTAAIFYAQTDRPNLTMEVYPIGRVTSDLRIFPDLPSRVDITFER